MRIFKFQLGGVHTLLFYFASAISHVNFMDSSVTVPILSLQRLKNLPLMFESLCWGNVTPNLSMNE